MLVSSQIKKDNNKWKGNLTSIYLSDGEYDLYGYCSATKTRIVVILSQKQNLEIYNETTLKQVMRLLGFFNLFLTAFQDNSWSLFARCV